MLSHLRRSVVFALICLAVFGLAYGFAGVGVSQALFGHQANGSLTAAGSTLIGQNWTGPMWFHGRPDDAGPYAATRTTPGGDNPLVANGHDGESGGTNLGPTSKVLYANTKALVAYWHSMGVDPTPDLVTTSGSGLDPDITPQDAIVQIPMVARARHLPASALRSLIASQTHRPELGFLGSSWIDVLQLNEALSRLR
jgi:K+-transporting ATPase ATPase C chain